MTGTNVAFTYNGISVGGDNFNRQLTDWNLNQSYSAFTFTATFTLVSDTAANLATLRTATLSGLEQQSKNFSLVNGATTILSVTEATKTNGYHGRPEITLTHDEHDSETRETYRFAIQFLLPADDSTLDTGGRLLANIAVTVAPNKYRIVEISGTYTCLTGSTSREQYVASLTAYVGTVMTLLSISNFKVDEDDFKFDDEQALCHFRAVRREVKVQEKEDGTFVAGIIEQNIGFLETIPCDSGTTASRTPGFQGSYAAILDSTAVAATGQRAFTLDTIMPNVVKLLKAKLDGTICVVNFQPNYRLDNSSVTVTFQGFTHRGDGDLVDYSREVNYQFSEQKEFRHQWLGKQHHFITSSPGPVIRARVTVTERVIGLPRLLGNHSFLESGPPTGSPFDFTGEVNYYRPGIPPFNGLLNGTSRRGPGQTRSTVGISFAQSSVGSGGVFGAGPEPSNYQPPLAPYLGAGPTFTGQFDTNFRPDFGGNGFIGPQFNRFESFDPDSVENTLGEVPGGGPTPRAAKPREIITDGSGEPYWIFIGANCGSTGRFTGYNRVSRSDLYDKVLISTTTYVTDWVWGVESALPVTTALIENSNPAPLPDRVLV